MFSSCLLSFVFVVFQLSQLHAGRHCHCPDDLISDPHLGDLPPHPGDEGSHVPRHWKWETVLVDDISSGNVHIRNQAKDVLFKNTWFSILFDRENRARKEYEAKEQEHIRNKQIHYNECMKEQWKKDRMISLPPRKCIISR